MDYEKKYKEALERARKSYVNSIKQGWTCDKVIYEEIFPELKESEDEKIRKDIIAILKGQIPYTSGEDAKKYISWLEKQGEPQDKGEISDGYHTFNELYYYRMLYNAAFFNMLPKELVHKSKRHHDGEECFGGGWFIVIANLPTGQISNHYELKDWELFQIPEKEVADKWDGHTPQEAAERLHKYLLEKQDEQESLCNKCRKEQPSHSCQDITALGRCAVEHEQMPVDKVKPKFKVGDWITNGEYIWNVTTIQPLDYILQSPDGNMVDDTIFYVDEQFHLWTIQDAKDGDVLANDNFFGCPFIYRESDDLLARFYCCVNFNNDFTMNDGLNYCGLKESAKPATKEQRDLLFQKMKAAGYEWNFEVKELNKI